MSTDSTDAFEQVQRELTAWHSTHPRATFAEIETAVEAQLDQLRQHFDQRCCLAAPPDGVGNQLCADPDPEPT